MSLNRLIYYSAIIGGWSAFLGWMVSESVLGQGGGWLVVMLTCALVGGAIGAGLNVVAGMANGQWKEQIKRVVPGLVAGGLGGAVGGLIGDVFYRFFSLPRAFGWMLMGAGIGVVEGLYERSPAKLRNGLIGGAVGGLGGGFFFDPIQNAIHSQSGMSSRATAFVILGMCIGILIGLVKVVMKQAWLTVLDGYRPGRQLILSEGQAQLGRGEWVALPFMGMSDNELELEHATIVREGNGRFVLEDKNSRKGTSVNNSPVNGRVILNDNDIIRIGGNSIQFSQRHRRADEAGPPISSAPQVSSPPVSAPPISAPMPQPERPKVPTPQATGAGPGYLTPPKATPTPTSPVSQPGQPVRTAPPKVTPPQGAPPPPVKKPTTQPINTVDGPAPSKPATTTTTGPVSPAKTAPPPAPAPAGSHMCPNGHVLPKSQRYCIVCDTNF